MRLAFHSFADDGEYVFVIDDTQEDPAKPGLSYVRPGYVLAVGDALYQVTSVHSDTVTAVPYRNTRKVE